MRSFLATPLGLGNRRRQIPPRQGKLLDFVAAGRRSCVFFRVELVFEPGLGPVLLTLR